MVKISIPEGYATSELTRHGDGVVELRLTDAGGKHWRTTIAPDDDIAGLPKDLHDAIAAHRTPERIAAYEAKRPPELPPPPDRPGPSLKERIAALEALLVEKNVVSEQEIAAIRAQTAGGGR